MSLQLGIHDSQPLTETTYLILVSLAPGPKHGYAIMQDVQALSGERIQLSTGTLYGALKRLLQQGYIERAQEKAGASAGPGRPRKTYTLTNPGRRLLDAEVDRLRGLVAAAELWTVGVRP